MHVMLAKMFIQLIQVYFLNKFIDSKRNIKKEIIDKRMGVK